MLKYYSRIYLDWRKARNPQSGQPVRGTIFEPGTSKYDG